MTPPPSILLTELTATARAVAEAAFAASASPEERARADRYPPPRSALYRHAHGALHRWPQPYRSLSYAAGRAWAALGEVPVGLDVVAAVDDRPLAPFVVEAEAEGVAPLVAGFPARLAAWAAKESVAKLTGEVMRPPEHWRLVRRGAALQVLADHLPPAYIVFTFPTAGVLAAIATEAMPANVSTG